MSTISDITSRREAEQRLIASERATRSLAAEQAALRRVATLVAADAPPTAVFEQVTEEVARLLGAPSANVIRYESDVRGRARRPLDLTGAGRPSGRLRPGRWTATPSSRGSGAAARQSASTTTGSRAEPLGEHLRARGYRASVAAPVQVSGRLWGALVASAYAPGGSRGRRRAPAVRLRRAHRPGAGQRRRLRAPRRVAGADRRGGRRRTTATRAQPPRRSPATPGLAVAAPAPHRCGTRSRPAGRPRRALARLGRAGRGARGAARARPRHPSRDAHRPRPRRRRSTRSRRARPFRSRSTGCPAERLPAAVEAAAYYIVAEAAHQRRQIRRCLARDASACSVTPDAARSTCTTTASAARTRRRARDCAGSPTASRRFAAAFRSRAHPATARASRPRFRSSALPPALRAP